MNHPAPRSDRVTRFPIPLVGAAALLAALIVLTPVLITGGGAGGTLLTQAYLLVDHAPGSNNTTFMVRAGGSVRYAEVTVGMNTSYSPSAPLSTLTWNQWTNASDTLGVVLSTARPSIALNVTVHYQQRDGSIVLYYGVVSVQYASGSLTVSALSPGISTPGGPIAIGSGLLPLSIPLDYLGNVGKVPPP